MTGYRFSGGKPGIPLNGDAVKTGEVTFADRIPVFPGFDPEFDNQGSRKAYTDRTAAVWRRRNLPDPVTADGLYAGTAPTITLAQSSSPTAGYLRYAPAGIPLSGSDVVGPFTYAGAADFIPGTQTGETNYVQPTSKYPHTYTNSQGTWSLEFGTDAQIIQLHFRYMSATASAYRLSIDGRKVTDLMQVIGSMSGVGTTGNGHLLTIDFGSAAPRRLRFDFSTMPFRGVFLPPTTTMWGPPLRGGRLAVLGDSISDGSNGNVGAACGTWVDRAGRLLGCTDVWRQGRGSTGYITAGSWATFVDRAQPDIVAYQPDRVIIWGGYNDSGGNQASIAAAADTVFSTIKTGLPKAEIYVIGCWSPKVATDPSASGQVATTATLKARAAAAKLPFISPQTGEVFNASGQLVATHGMWITGTGRIGATTGSGNADLYISTDALHPSDAGHIYLARRITAALTELMPA